MNKRIMYYSETYVTQKDIHVTMVFRRRRFGRRRRTVRRNTLYRPSPGKVVSRPVKIVEGTNRIEGGIFSYKRWCPMFDHSLEIWSALIPRGTKVYSNSWECVSDRIVFLGCH